MAPAFDTSLRPNAYETEHPPEVAGVLTPVGP